MTLLLFVTALSLSVMAAYYAVVGLVAIFSAAVIPVMIMGSLLEASKLVVASWLYRTWKEIPVLMKTYFTIALVLLMGLTSMGIFGFLSKAHIEQTAMTQENLAQIQRIDTEVKRFKETIETAEQKVNQLQTTGTGADVNVQSQIDTEQKRIDTAYERIQPAIDEQNKIIQSQTKLFEDQIKRIDDQLTTLQNYINTGEIAKAQSMVGSKADGNWGPATAASVKQWQAAKERERAEVLNKLQELNNSATVKAARTEIQRLRSTAEAQVAESNKLVSRLREQLGKSDTKEIEALINVERERITEAQQQIDELTKTKYSLETEYRKLEAEVGPIKYIAEFVYGTEADKNMLEQAVRWVIIVIILVFDPLAVLLLIAANFNLKREQNGTEIKQTTKAKKTTPKAGSGKRANKSTSREVPIPSEPREPSSGSTPTERRASEVVAKDPRNVQVTDWERDRKVVPSKKK